MDGVKRDGEAPGVQSLASLAVRPSVDAWRSGTYVQIEVGPGTTMGNLRTHHNKWEHWALILRTFTAVGFTAIGRSDEDLPHWARRMNVQLALEEVPNAKSGQVPFRFPFPHEQVPFNEVTQRAVKELWLQKNPSDKREYRTIYMALPHTDLKSQLREELKALEEGSEENEAIADAFDAYEVDAYAALGYENTLWDELNKELIDQADAKVGVYSNLSGGVLISSVEMPIGELHRHQNDRMRPELKRRYFLLLNFNDDYIPDIGRKTIPRKDIPLIEWLEDTIRKWMDRQSKRLVKAEEDKVRGGGDAVTVLEEVKEYAKQIHARNSGKKLTGLPLPVPYPVTHEPEVVVNFASLVASGHLSGYELLGIPGSPSRYDALINYTASSPTMVAAVHPWALRRAGSRTESTD